MDLEVGIPVDIVYEEAHRLHVSHQATAVSDEATLRGSKELPRRREIAFDKGLIDLHVDTDLREVGLVFGSEVDARTDEVPDIAQDEARHHRIPVDDAEHCSGLVEEDIIYLGIAVDGAFGELTLSVELLL